MKIKALEFGVIAILILVSIQTAILAVLGFMMLFFQDYTINLYIEYFTTHYRVIHAIMFNAGVFSTVMFGWVACNLAKKFFYPEVDLCYKTDKPCPYECDGLCKESC